MSMPDICNSYVKSRRKTLHFEMIRLKFWGLPNESRFLFALVFGVFVLVTAQYILSSRFSDNIEDLRQRLAADRPSSTVDIEALPEIVRNFARRAGAEVGAPTLVRLTQSATMKLAPDQPWQNLAADHIASNYTSGFVWYASGTMMGFVPIGVVDAFVEGRGVLNARLFNSISVASASGPAADRGEMLRYLAEIPWTPDAILNNPELTWTQINATTVTVSAPTPDGLALVRFVFDDAGDIIHMQADDRPMGFGDAYVPTPWKGEFSHYTQMGPRRIPTHGEVAWILPEGNYTYFRGELMDYALE